MNLEIIHSLNEEAWRSFVQRHPCGNIFHTPEMFQVFARVEGHKPALWAVIDRNQSPLALLLPVQITLKNGMLHLLTTRAVVYGSVLYAPNPEGQDALASLMCAYQKEVKNELLFTELRNLTDLHEIQPVLEDSGFPFENHLNFIIDLRQTIDGMWDRLDPNAKSNIKKARRKGVIIEDAVSPETVRISYSLLQEVYGRIHVPLADYSLFQAVFDILVPKGMAKFFMARANEINIGTSIVLLYKDAIYGWYAGVSNGYSSFKAGDMLNWHILEWGAQNGYSRFDFGGAGKPGEQYGPRDFKAKFGGELVNYGRNVCVHSPLALGVSKSTYALMQRFLSIKWKTK